LDFPDFYNRLYSLLEPSVFDVKHRKRFFRLLDLFLSSSYLPNYLVASFAKKLARLSLTAPPHGCVLCIIVIYNLLQRHSTLRSLVHRPPQGPTPQFVLLIGNNYRNAEDPEEKPIDKYLGFDPFLDHEKDPEKTHASNSSLWELETLASHYAPAISRMVKIFEGNFSRPYKMEDFISNSYQTVSPACTKKKTTIHSHLFFLVLNSRWFFFFLQLIETEMNRKVKGTPAVAFTPSESLFPTENTDFACWTFQ
jgi:U3 small nucleolar RNA-associated protein 19